MILINNLSSELFNNKLIFTDEKEVDTLIKNILKSKVINNEKRRIYLDFLSLDSNYSERLILIANKYHKSINEITLIIKNINTIILNSNHIIYLLCLTNQPFFNQMSTEEQKLLYKYNFHLSNNQTWPIIIDEDINNLHQNLINYLKKLELKSRKWSKLVLSSLNDYEKKVFNCLLSSKYYEQGSPKKKHDLEIIFQKSEKVIRTFEIYNSFRKAINSQIVIPKIYYYFSEEDLAIFKYYYNNLNNLVVKSLSHARYQTLANLIDKINDIKDNKKLSFSITKLLSKIQSSTVLERENFFHSLKKEQLNVLKKATKLYEQNLDIMKNLNHEEKITYALLMRKVDEELVKVKRKHIKSIYPKQLFRFYNGEYKNIQIEKALNLLTKKEYQLLSNYLNNITDTEHENIINQIIYVKIPNLIETLEENAQTKDNLSIIKTQFNYFQSYFGEYSLDTFNEVINNLNKSDQILILKYITNQIYSQKAIYFTNQEKEYFAKELLPKFKEMLEEIEKKSQQVISDFKNYTIEELKKGINSLSQREQDIIYLKFGHNLGNKTERELTPNETRIYQNIVRRNLNKILIQNRLLNSVNDTLQNLINSYQDLQFLKNSGISDINILIYAINNHLVNEDTITMSKLKEILKISEESISYIISECNAILTIKPKTKVKK